MTAPHHHATTQGKDTRRARTSCGERKSILLSESDARQIFREIDRNDNGELSQIEFIKALRSNPSLAERLGLPTTIKQEDESRRMCVVVCPCISSTL